MTWQKCPVCDGTGIDYTPGVYSSTQRPCTVCGGAKIIDEATGRPPAHTMTVVGGDITKEECDQIAKTIMEGFFK